MATFLEVVLFATLGCGQAEEETTTQTSALVGRLAAFPNHVLPVNLVNVNSNKCLNTRAAGTGNNVTVEQLDCTGVRSEEWWLTPVASGKYQIHTGHIGRCLNRANGSSANNTVVQQYSCAGAPDAEHWEFNTLPDGTVEIRAPGTTQCLDITGGSLANGATAQMYACIGVANEKWRISPVFDANSVMTSKNNGKCMTIQGAGQGNNALAVSSACQNGHAEQRWVFESVGDGSYYIRSKNSNRCLDVPNGTTMDIQLQQYDCIGVTNERWTLVEDGETDYVTIKNVNSSKCIQANATTIVQTLCGTSSAQRWRVGYAMNRRVKQLAVAHANGTDRRTLAETVVQPMVSRVNSVFGSSGITLGYSVAAGDKININDEAVFNLSHAGTFLCSKNGQMMTPGDCANLYAADFPNDLVIIPNESGGGAFSDVGMRYVALVYPNNGAGTCQFNDVNIAHEFGHYLGLLHTFSAGGDVAALSAALQAAGDDQFRAFDGDGLLDTPPEPYDTAWNTCAETAATKSLTLTGTSGPVTIAVPLQNILSYYYDQTKKISTQQSGIVRALMRIRWF